MIEQEIVYQHINLDMLCPLCQQAMYDIEAVILNRSVHFFQCLACQHKIYPQQDRVCHCSHCVKERKKQMTATLKEESLKYKTGKQKDKNTNSQIELNQLSFMHQLFLLSILEHHLTEEKTHQEFFNWHFLKYQKITANYQFQQFLFKQLIQNHTVIEKTSFIDDAEEYFLNISLDGYPEPSLFSIAQLLRQAFYNNLNHHIPFVSAEELKSALYMMIYQELIQYMQHLCQAWNVQIAGNKLFETLCYKMIDHLALSQIYHLLYKALNYLQEIQALKTRNENFINTNILRKTIEKYYDNLVKQRWETSNQNRPEHLPFSTMSQIFFVRFLQLDENTFYHQPIWKLWKKIEPRLTFFAKRHCMHCGSLDVYVEYDQNQQVTLYCESCKQQDHYFIGA